MAEFRMPALGADMTEGTLLEWLVHPGDQVRKGDIVAVVDTAKAAIEVECFENGTVDRLLVEPGTTMPVGASLAVIGPARPATQTSEPSVPVTSPLVRHLAEESGVDLATVHGTGPGGRITRADVNAEPPSAAPLRTPPAETATTKPPDTPRVRPEKPPTPPARPGTGDGATRVRATPLAKRLAVEAGIDLAAVAGTGTGGAVRALDVKAALAAALPSAATARPAAATGRHETMRRAVGDLMARSKREIPHYYLSTTVDLGAAIGWLHERNRELPVAERLVPTALLLKAAALAAREVPQLNGFWTDDHFTAAPAVHLGVAVALRGGGLVAPAIHDATDLTLPELMARLRDLVSRARSGRLHRSETTDPTITVTNLGDQGVEAVLGVIYPPQVALVGLGRVVERPWAVDGLLGIRPVVTATLSADHRASDGATGARYLAALDRLLQKPEEL
ncbi:2-oxo acid dehydrogenase subunit E2 [Kitasatospora sp. NPDC001175]|uniref:2-oxo acid dehydrogenase subunit E2 n=1 Tax=Kitasatospora sp. NPDC001175 TaxID=3157103 RepID=UPI003D03A5D9